MAAMLFDLEFRVRGSFLEFRTTNEGEELGMILGTGGARKRCRSEKSTFDDCGGNGWHMGMLGKTHQSPGCRTPADRPNCHTWKNAAAWKLQETQDAEPGTDGSVCDAQQAEHSMSGLSADGSAHDEQETEQNIPGFLVLDTKEAEPHVCNFAEDGVAQLEQKAVPSVLELLEDGAAHNRYEAKSSIPNDGSADDKDATDNAYQTSQDVYAPDLDSKENSSRQRQGNRLCKAKRERLQMLATRLIERCGGGDVCPEELMALEVPLSIQQNGFMMRKLRRSIAVKLAAKKSVPQGSSKAGVFAGFATGRHPHHQHAEQRKSEQVYERQQGQRKWQERHQQQLLVERKALSSPMLLQKMQQSFVSTALR